MTIAVTQRFSLKKDDLVQVIAGREKGKSGKVVRVYPKTGRITIEKVNLVKRHQKPSQANAQGGIVEKEASLHISNVSLVDKSGKATKAGYKVEGDKKVRVAKTTGETL